MSALRMPVPACVARVPQRPRIASNRDRIAHRTARTHTAHTPCARHVTTPTVTTPHPHSKPRQAEPRRAREGDSRQKGTPDRGWSHTGTAVARGLPRHSTAGMPPRYPANPQTTSPFLDTGTPRDPSLALSIYRISIVSGFGATGVTLRRAK